MRTYMNVEGWPWAADNRAYVDWDPDAYLRMLERIADIPGCLFVTAPDVVGDHEATLSQFHDWEDTLSGFPVAFVAQNGCTISTVPWDRIAALFIGGNREPDGTEWKLGPDAAELIKLALLLGKHVHMGRVNTQRRFLYAQAMGCHSVDGTKFSKFRHTYLPTALDMCSQPPQMMFA